MFAVIRQHLLIYFSQLCDTVINTALWWQKLFPIFTFFASIFHLIGRFFVYLLFSLEYLHICGVVGLRPTKHSMLFFSRIRFDCCGISAYTLNRIHWITFYLKAKEIICVRVSYQSLQLHTADSLFSSIVVFGHTKRAEQFRMQNISNGNIRPTMNSGKFPLGINWWRKSRSFVNNDGKIFI